MHDVASLGQHGLHHALLAAGVTVAESGSLVLTGQLSVRSHPWLADYEVAGRVLVPSTALVDLALYAGDQVGCASLADLTVQMPLWLPSQETVRIQAVVSPSDEAAVPAGQRMVSVYSQHQDSDSEWICHARGHLTVEENAGAESPDVDGIDVSLPEEVVADGFLVHPALLDAALRDALAANGDELMPAEFSGVRVSAVGARSIRTRVSRAGDGTVSVIGVDPAGEEVFAVQRVAARTVDVQQPDGMGGDLFRLDWVAPSDTVREKEAVPGWSVLNLAEGSGLAELVGRICDTAAEGKAGNVCVVAASDRDVVSGVHGLVADVLGVVQRWLAGELNGKSLVVVTRGAVVVNAGERPVDLAGAAVWGLVRSVQVEHPGRVVLVDVDDDP
ncbi:MULTISPECIES: polyketide synthase dehydratase domain-containing protein, partial [unclassified Streptomyces]|uniref:SpnB-like Rossmann fold domain-containing protein n=1 Tax=unclassified Streptomyces TaxID=2593676 RepID=UPI0036F0EDA2